MAFTRPKAAQIDFDITNITDPLIRLNSGQSGANDKDVGIVIERGDDTNVAVLYDESADQFVLVNTTEDGSTSGNVTISSYANLQANAIVSGNINSTGTLTVSGAVNFNDTTGSTSTTTGALIVDGGVGIAENLYVGGTIDMDRLSLTSSQTTVPPLRLTANSLNDGVGALRIDGSQADIYLNPSTATHTTVTFAVNDDQRLAFGMDNNSDFYITRRTGGSWYDDTFVLDRDTGLLSLGYGATVAGTLTYSTLNDGTTALTSTVAELNYVDGVTSNIQTQIDNISSSFTLAADSGSNDTFTTGQTLTISGGTGIDTTVSDNNISIAIDSTVATQSYVTTQISNLVDSAPAALDTLNELAAALGDDANFSTTVTNSIATKLPLAGGTMSGAIAMGANAITGMADPSSAQDAATKAYVDSQVSSVPTGDITSVTASTGLTGGGTTGDVTLSIDNSTVATLTDTQTLSNKTLTEPKIASGGYIADANGNEQIVFTTTASAVNYFTVTNTATGANQINLLGAAGGDTNIGIGLSTKGTGNVQIGSGLSAGANPSRKLQIYPDSASKAAIGIQAYGTTATEKALIDFFASNGTALTSIGQGAATSELFRLDSVSGYIFATGSGSHAGGTERLRIDSSGEVGINTASGGAKLRVSKGASTSAGIFEGSGYQTYFGYGGNDDNYISTGASGSNIFRSGATERMRIDSSGNVGIGTSSVATTLHVYENTSNGTINNIALLDAGNQNPSVAGSGVAMDFRSGNGSSYFGAVGGYSDGTNYVAGLWGGAAASSAPDLAVTSSGNVGIGTSSPTRHLSVNGSIQFASGGVIEAGTSPLNTYIAGIQGASGRWAFATNGAERMRIDSSGNVGIGVTTVDTALGTKLHVAGTIRTDTGSAGANPAIVFDHDNFGDADANYIMLDRTSEAMRFNVNASERMRLTSDGRLGLGTSAPAVELEIASGQPELRLTDTDGTDQESTFVQAGGTLYLNLQNNTSNGALRVRGFASGSPTDHFLVNGSGNVGIGTTSPANNLDVNGDIGVLAQNEVKFYDSDSSNYTSFRGASSVTSNIVWTLPNADGTDGQVLSTNGGGTLSWADAGAGGGGGGGGSSYPNSTITTIPGIDGNYDLSYNAAQTEQETPFESGGTDAFGVNLGTVFDMSDPVGSVQDSSGTGLDLGTL